MVTGPRSLTRDGVGWLRGMSPLLDPASYKVSLASLPFAVAAITTGMVLAYALVMRGAPQLRGPILVLTIGMLSHVVGTGLGVAAPTDEAAIAFFRLCVAPVPLATMGAVTFQLAIAQRMVARRRWIVAGFVIAIGFLLGGWLTPYGVDAIIITPSGQRFWAPGPLIFPGVAFVGLISVGGFYEVERALRLETSVQRRRQLRGANLSLAVQFLATVDVLLIFGSGWAPVGWVFTTLGTLLALRSILLDDLLRARALDSRAPAAFAAVAMSAAGGWVLATYLLPRLPWFLVPVPLLGLIVASRLAVALGVRLGGLRPRGEGPLDRLATQYASRVHQLTTVPEIARLTGEVLDLGLGAVAVVLVPARDDWSWRSGDGEAVAEDASPEPLLVPWLAEHHRPIHRDELEVLRLSDLRPALARLFTAYDATAIVPLVARDELIGLLIINDRTSGRALRKVELALVEGVADRLGTALAYIRVAGHVASRAAMAREVELAAAVQSAFVPRPELMHVGACEVLGSWEPASRCGGDWWDCYELPGGCTLVVIGDVTGSGVAAAMVTAAAKGACDVAVRLMADAFDLSVLFLHLDAAVRRVGAGRFHLTCFASIIDPVANEVRFANAGHLAPYLCRPRDPAAAAAPPSATDAGVAQMELYALVARGNPLGAGTAPVTRTATRAIAPGDVLVWYTDGVVEGRNAEGKQFGDRRLQRVLRRLDPERLDPAHVHALIAAELAAYLAGLPAGDDMTLVVARVALARIPARAVPA